MLTNTLAYPHFENPNNHGALNNPTTNILMGNPHEGALIRLQLQIENNIIEDIKFKAYGAVAIVCMSYLTEKVKNQNLDKAMHINSMDIIQDLNLSTIEMGSALLSVDILQKSIMDYQKKEKKVLKFKNN